MNSYEDPFLSHEIDQTVNMESACSLLAEAEAFLMDDKSPAAIDLLDRIVAFQQRMGYGADRESEHGR